MAEKMTEREQFYYGKGYNKAIEEAADLARKPNKMEFVAALFGKKLGEEFRVKSCHPEGNCVGCFSRYGFEGQNQTATVNVAVFLLLLTGKAVIVDD